MPITNATLAQQVSDLLSSWQLREDELNAWMTGVYDGGVYANGTFPLTDSLGVTAYYKSPGRLEYDVSGLVGSASAYADAASASEVAAGIAQAAAEAARNLALSYQSGAQAARDLALSYRDDAANSAANAGVYATNAANSAAAALISETNAAASETAAGISETNAAQSAVDAAASAAAAATFDPAFYAALSDNEIITGNYTFKMDTIGDHVFWRNGTTGASGVAFRNDDGIKGYIAFDDAGAFNIYDAATSSKLVVDAAGNLAADGNLSGVGAFITSTVNLGWSSTALYASLHKDDGMVFRPHTTSGGWARGMSVIRQSDAIRAAGAGWLGNAEAVTGFYIGLDTSWWSTYKFAVTAASGIVMNDTVRPLTTNATDLGIAGARWNNVHAATYYESGQTLASKYAALTGGTFTGDFYLGTGGIVRFRASDGYIYPQTDNTSQLGGLTNRFMAVYATTVDAPNINGKTIVSSGASNALWFNSRNDTGNFAWYADTGSEAQLFNSGGSGDIVTVSSTGALWAKVSLSSPRLLQPIGTLRGIINAEVADAAYTYGSPLLGDGVQSDFLAFRARSNCEYLVGSTWTARTDTYDTVFDGRGAGGYGGNYSIPTGEDGVRWTWTNVGYVFIDHVLVMGSSAGNTIRITLEKSANGTDWVTMRQSGWASTWPGAHLFNVQSNTASGTAYFRLTIERDHVNANDVSVGKIRAVGLYGLGQRLFEWNYDRKLTFANRIEIGGTGYEVDPGGMVLGQYTATTGYIQAPGGANGVIDIWTGGTSYIARFANANISIARHVYPDTTNTKDIGSTSLLYAGVYATNHCGSYLWDAAGAKNAVQMTDTYLRLNQSSHFTSGIYTPGVFRADGGIDFGASGLGSMRLGSGNSAKFSNSNGYVEVGPQNASWCHISTDRAGIYMGARVSVNGGISDYNAGSERPYLHLTNTGMTSGGNVTFSTSAPSGGADGDIWFVYT